MFTPASTRQGSGYPPLESGGASRWWLFGEEAVFGLAVLWIFVIFASWNLAQAMLGAAPYFGMASESFFSFSEKASWLPLAVEVARGNLLPTQPSLASGANGLSFFFYLSVWAQGLLVALFGLQYAQIIGSTLFPTACFAVLVLIYCEYIPLRWSIALAALGVVSFSDSPLRVFVIHLLLGQGWAELGVSHPPNITMFPFPAFSLLMFLLAFRSSTRRVYLTPLRMTALTIFWALQSQVHVTNAVLGLPFWFLILGITLWRRERDGNVRRVALTVARQMSLAFVLCLPAVIGYFGVESLEEGVYSLLASDSQAGGDYYSAYYNIAYFLMPLVLLMALYFIFRFDIYEALYKFWPVFLAMVLEFFLLNLYRFFSVGIPSELIFNRLSLFFLHPFYYVPIIYFLSREAERQGSVASGQRMLQGLQSMLVWLTRDASKVYIPMGLSLLTLYGAASAMEGFKHAETVQKPSIIEARNRMATLTQGAPAGSTLVGDMAAMNLMLPVEGHYGTLWVNRFANRITAAEAVERLALSARLLGWSEDVFVRFMSPDVGSLLRPGFLIELGSDDWPSGLGYWLVFHWQRLPDASTRATFEASIRRTYQTLDVPTAVKQFGVRRVLSAGKLPARVPVQAVRQTAYGILYEIGPLEGSRG